MWRWEASLESFFGRAYRESHAEATSEGWLVKVQDRTAWKRHEWVFARAQWSTALAPLSCRSHQECCPAYVCAQGVEPVRFSTPLSLSLISSSNFGRVHSLLFFFGDAFSLIESAEFVGDHLVVVRTPSTAVLGGTQILGSVSLVQVRLSLAAVLKTAPSSRGERSRRL